MATDWNECMTDAARLITPEKRGEDLDATMRPQSLDEFTGQAEARANLKIFIEAAKNRGEALDHVLFVGPQDLSVALDVPNQWEAPVMNDAIRRVVDAAERSNVVVGIQGRNPELASRWMAEGVRFVVMGTTLMLLTEAARNGINELRKRSDAIDGETYRVPAKS